MTENEVKLINTIRNSEDPAVALTTAVEIIVAYLQQQKSSA